MDIKPLRYKELPGLSEKQLSEHHDILYVGYVNKLKEIREKQATVDLSLANQTYSDFRELKIEEGFVLDAVKLHELYFENMGQSQISESMTNLIAENFGSFEKWQDEFVACGMSARGWVVLALDEDNVLRHYICDAHNQGGIWSARPVLVLDTYEHAYFIDYGTNRKAYLEGFLQNIDWKVTESRINY